MMTPYLFPRIPVDHPYGWLSLLPPLVAVGMAILTKRVFVSLLAGIAVGTLIMSHGDVIVATAQLLETQLFQTLIEPSKLRLMSFTLLIGATIGIVSASGGMASLVELLSPLARGRRSGQVVVWGSGLLVFFDDYANTLLLGSTFRSTCDRLGISRQKLAYLVDSTAAPVAGLAIVSTWIAVEIDYINAGLANIPDGAGQDIAGFNLFLGCIPYRFYVIQALLLVLLVGMLGRDFGPMLTAERNARDAKARGESPPDVDQPIATSHWLYAVLPIVVTLVVVLWLMISTGITNVAAMVAEGKMEPPEEGTLLWFRSVFGQADSGLALQYGGLLGFGFAVAMCRLSRKLPGSELWNGAVAGAKSVLPAVFILWFAGALSRMTGNESLAGEASVGFEFDTYRLYTGDYLKQLLDELSKSPDLAEWFAFLLPTIVFVLSSFVAFSTGTSFGTMGILLPMIIPLAYGTLATQDATFEAEPMMLASIGSVMAGAIFGDHCSPISDTTILSSQASGCDHVEHVNTQLPYALLGGGVAIVCGTLLVGTGISVWLLLGLQSFVLFALMLVLGRKSNA